MSDYNEGDLVEAVKGETVIRGRLLRAELTTNRHIIELPPITADPTTYIETYESAGFTVTVIERAKPALPTEPGAIICWETVHFTGLAVLEKTDQWCYNGVTLNGVALLHEIEDAPFTRLEPVPETAARFAARLHTVVQPKIESSWYTKSTAKAILKQADEIAADFGVQS